MAKDIDSKDEREKVMKEIAQMLEKMKFGTVTIVIQNSKVVQIDKTEKVRLC